MAASTLAVEPINNQLRNDIAKAKRDLLSPAAQIGLGIEWPCIICTYSNPGNISRCELCLTPRTIIKSSSRQNNIHSNERTSSRSRFKPSHISIPSSPQPSSSKRSRSVPKYKKKTSFTPNPTSTNHTRINRSKSSIPTPPSKSHQQSDIFSFSKNRNSNGHQSPETPLNELFEIASKKPCNKKNKFPKSPINPFAFESRSKSKHKKHKKHSSFLGLTKKKSKRKNRFKSSINKQDTNKHRSKSKDKHDIQAHRRAKSGINVDDKQKQKSRNLSNTFFNNKKKDQNKKHENQIKLSKSKTHTKRLSIHKRNSKTRISKNQVFEFPFPANKNKMVNSSKLIPSISLPDEYNNISNNNGRGLMQQSITSPLATSPWNSPCVSPTRSNVSSQQSNDSFLSAPSSRRITLYKLPAEKHKILSPRIDEKKDESGNTTSLPSNFSFASQVYKELQSKLQERNSKQERKVLQIYEASVQKHESILLEILKSVDNEMKQAERNEIIDTIINARCDVLCHFLPLIAFTVCQTEDVIWRMKLLNKLKDRIVGQSDLRQAVRFFMQAYGKIGCVKAMFAGICTDVDINVNNKVVKNDILPKDCIRFWYHIASMKNLKDNDYFIIPMNTIIRDPVKQLSAPLRRVLIRKIINSNSKPLLIDCYGLDKANFEFLSSTFILKYGDDLRKDKSCMLVFKWINHLFSDSVKCKGIKVLTYNVIPMSKLFGCIQLIANCIPLRDILSLKSDISLKCDNLISTAAGSYIVSYIMGVRDRHFDNILIRKTDFTLFHIDMNYVLGDTITGLDANKFGITKEFYDLLGKNNYKKFIKLSCNAFVELRKHYRQLTNFACLAFSYVYNYNKIRRHIYKQLRMNESDKKSINWLKTQLENAPFDKQTQMKNIIHKFATR